MIVRSTPDPTGEWLARRNLAAALRMEEIANRCETPADLDHVQTCAALNRTTALEIRERAS
jgi:hypothetical protein